MLQSHMYGLSHAHAGATNKPSWTTHFAISSTISYHEHKLSYDSREFKSVPIREYRLSFLIFENST